MLRGNLFSCHFTLCCLKGVMSLLKTSLKIAYVLNHYEA